MMTSIKTLQCFFLVVMILQGSQAQAAAESLCPHLNVEHGRAHITNRNFCGNLTVECNKGYWYTETLTRICQQNGEWTGNPGLCKAVRCPLLPNPPHGNIDYTGRGYNNITEVICDAGYEFSHPMLNKQTCQTDNKWTVGIGICEPVKCPSAEIPRNGHVHVTNHYENGTALISCNEGYIYNGTKTIICQRNGQWKGTVGMCLVKCPALGEMEHGHFLYHEAGHFQHIKTSWNPFDAAICPLCKKEDEITPGDTAEIFCDQSYRYTETSIRICQKNGHWGGKPGICKDIECPFPRHPVNCSVVISHLFVNGIAKFTGTLGYVYIGDTVRICLFDGQWNGTDGRCEEIRCETSPAIKNGIFPTVLEDRYKAKLRFVCDNGFVFNGSNEVTCESDGNWSTPNGECKPETISSRGVIVGFVILGIMAFLVVCPILCCKIPKT